MADGDNTQDISILSGDTDSNPNVDNSGVGMPDALPAAGPISGGDPGAATMQQAPPTPTAVAAPNQPAAPTAQQIASAAPALDPAAPSGVKGIAKLLIQGAIYGLANSGGATHFGSGLGRGAEGYVQHEQQDIENANTAKQLNFASLKAADSHIEALNSARAADDAHEEHKLVLTQQQQAIQEVAEEHGMKPKLTIESDNNNDMHSQATGALTTLAQQNGGTIPQVATTNGPSMKDDPDHTVHVYSVSQNDVTQNPNGVNWAINESRKVQGLPPLSDSDIQIQGGQRKPGNWKAGAADMANDAQKFLFTVPPTNPDAANNAATAATMEQQLNAYKNRPDADPGVVKMLTSNLTAFNSAAEAGRSKAAGAANATTNQESQTKANAAAQEEGAKTQAQINVQTAPGNVAKEAGRAAAMAGAKRADDTKPVFAYNTQTGQTEQTTPAEMDAKPGVFTNPAGVKQSDIDKAKLFNQQVNDVQLNVSRYRNAFNQQTDNISNEHARMINEIVSDKGLGAKLTLGGVGADISQINDAMTKAGVANMFNKLTPQEQSVTLGYLRSREAIIAYNRAVTGSGRTSEKATDIALSNLPLPSIGATSGNKFLDAFQENIDTLGKSAVKLPGIESAQQIRQRVEGNAGANNQGAGNKQAPRQNAPAPPPGATMKVPGSDGKLHWSDGKSDLGVAQ